MIGLADHRLSEPPGRFLRRRRRSPISRSIANIMRRDLARDRPSRSERHDVFLAILGISWFWFLGVVFLTQIPLFAQSRSRRQRESSPTSSSPPSPSPSALGSIVTNRLLKGEVSVKYVPVAAILITVFIIDLYFATAQPARTGARATALMPVEHRAHVFAGWRVLIDLGAHRLLSPASSSCRSMRWCRLAHRRRRARPRHRRQQYHQRPVHDGGDRPLGAPRSKPASRRAASSCSLGLANAFAALYICQLLPQELVAYAWRAGCSDSSIASRSRASRISPPPAAARSSSPTTPRCSTARCSRPSCPSAATSPSTPMSPIAGG